MAGAFFDLDLSCLVGPVYYFYLSFWSFSSLLSSKLNCSVFMIQTAGIIIMLQKPTILFEIYKGGRIKQLEDKDK